MRNQLNLDDRGPDLARRWRPPSHVTGLSYCASRLVDFPPSLSFIFRASSSACCCSCRCCWIQIYVAHVGSGTERFLGRCPEHRPSGMGFWLTFPPISYSLSRTTPSYHIFTRFPREKWKPRIPILGADVQHRIVRYIQFSSWVYKDFCWLIYKIVSVNVYNYTGVTLGR